jgi:hypothetical protein
MEASLNPSIHLCRRALICIDDRAPVEQRASLSRFLTLRLLAVMTFTASAISEFARLLFTN